MPITFVPETQTFYLDTDNTSAIFRVYDQGYILTEYWGKRIHHADLTRLQKVYASGFSPNYPGAVDRSWSLDLIPTEYPVYGGGDYRSPAVQVQFPDGSRLLDLKYHSHRVLEGKPELPGPAASGRRGLHAGADPARRLFRPGGGVELLPV